MLKALCIQRRGSIYIYIYIGYYIRVHDRQCLRHEYLDYHISRARLKYHNLGTSVVNIVSHGHECNILFIT